MTAKLTLDKTLFLKERGIWVYRTGKPLSAETTDAISRAIREEREDQHLGNGTCGIIVFSAPKCKRS